MTEIRYREGTNYGNAIVCEEDCVYRVTVNSVGIWKNKLK